MPNRSLSTTPGGAINRDAVLREMYSKRDNNMRKNTQDHFPEPSVDPDDHDDFSNPAQPLFQRQENPEPRLFALLIGINKYKSAEFLPLRGAEPDTLRFKKYLMEALKVPERQITVLLNENATRENIINSLKSLESDSRISKGDPILIFYAGHGGETPMKDPSGQEYKIQMVVPSDFSVDGVNKVPGIPDLTIGTLLDNIADKKGDNITVIFDCCNAASGTRGLSDTLTRSVELPSGAYIPNFDEKFIYTSTRSSKPIPKFRHAGIKSHMLLAACGASEEAKETRGHGNFSTALLSLLQSISPEKLRYSDVLTQMDAISGQNPQCEGANRHRILFNAKVLPPFSNCYKIEFRQVDQWSPEKQLVLDAGAAHGVTTGAKFAIYGDNSMGRVLDTVTVYSVFAFHSIANHSPGLSLHNSCVAVQTMAGQKEDFKLYIPSNDKFLEVYKKVLGSKLSTKYQLYNITLVNRNNSASAHIHASMKDSTDVVFEMVDQRVTQHGFRRMKFNPVPTDDLDIVAWVLNQVAHYYRELNRSNSDPDITGKISIKFYKLKPGLSKDGWRTFQPEGRNFCANGVVDFVVEEGAPYGLTITNNSPVDLYPYVYYFDSSSLAISSYYQTPLSDKYAGDVPLKKCDGSLSLGHGSAGVTPFSYELMPDQDIDVGFLKIFLSTQTIDLSKIPQPSPFEAFRATRPYKEKLVEKWDTVLIPMIQRRKKPSQGSKKSWQ